MDARIAREPSVRAAIDEACRLWSAGHGWPRMDEETSVFVWDRLVEARSFAEFLATQSARVPDRTEPDVLAWLLIDYWVMAGFYRWYARRWALQRSEQ
jgi:hypothetical protein